MWEQGTGKYNNYRIPSLIVTQKGTLLAFYEGREGGDSGNIDLLLKRSENNGKTWSNEQVVWNDGSNTCGNPCPVVDETTGRIWLWMTWNNGNDHESEIIHKTASSPRLPYLCYSDDDGETWSTPENMSESCRDTIVGMVRHRPRFWNSNKKRPAQRTFGYSSQPQLQRSGGKHLETGSYGYGAHVLYSDDHGKTWNRSESIKPGCNESQVTELSDGILEMNMRSYNDKYCRAISFSKDGGETWSKIEHDYQLVESKCQASILNFGQLKEKQTYLFLNPAVPEGRNHLTLKASFDDCKNWSNSKLIYAGPAAYSCLAKLPNGKIGMFFEAGQKSAYEKLVFIAFNVDQLFQPETLLTSVTF